MTQSTDKDQMGFTAESLQGLTTAPSSAIWMFTDRSQPTQFAALTDDKVYTWEECHPGWNLSDLSVSAFLAQATSEDWIEISPDEVESDLADSRLVLFTEPDTLSGPVPIVVSYGHIEGDVASEVVTLSVGGRGLAFGADRAGELATILAGIADAVALGDDMKVYGS